MYILSVILDSSLFCTGKKKLKIKKNPPQNQERFCWGICSVETLSEGIPPFCFSSLMCFLAHCFHQTRPAWIGNYQSTLMELHNLTCARRGVAPNSTFSTQQLRLKLSSSISDVSGRCSFISVIRSLRTAPSKPSIPKGAQLYPTSCFSCNLCWNWASPCFLWEWEIALSSDAQQTGLCMAQAVPIPVQLCNSQTLFHPFLLC